MKLPAKTHSAVRSPARDFVDAVLVVEEDAEEARQADEAAEGDAVEEAEPERVDLAQHGEVVGQPLRRRLVRAVLGAQEEDRARRPPSAASRAPSPPASRYAAARRGMNSDASTVPELPAPAMPITSPWYCGGYQREASGSATAKLAPGMPSSSATTNSRGSESATSQPSSSGTKVSAMPISPVRRGPR